SLIGRHKRKLRVRQVHELLVVYPVLIVSLEPVLASRAIQMNSRQMAIGGIESSLTQLDVLLGFRREDVITQNELRMQVSRGHRLFTLLGEPQLLAPKRLPIVHVPPQHRKVNSEGQINSPWQ